MIRIMKRRKCVASSGIKFTIYDAQKEERWMKTTAIPLVSTEPP
jgi:uncharacterized membrane protein (UPF0127 family)